jgi:hypothetical protein
MSFTNILKIMLFSSVRLVSTFEHTSLVLVLGFFSYLANISIKYFDTNLIFVLDSMLIFSWYMLSINLILILV